MPGPNANGFALQWNIGLKVYFPAVGNVPTMKDAFDHPP